MLIKRIVCALLVTGLIAISSNLAQAQSIGRRTWIRGNSANNPAPTVPDQSAERAPVAEMQTVSQELQTAAQAGLLDKKTAIAGSWQGTVGDGNRVVASFTSDGIVHGSVQTEVSTIPELGVLTPTHGVWTYVGGRQFSVTSVGILYDINTGAYLGYLKIRVLLTLDGAGDQMSGTDNVQLFGPDDTLVDTFPSGTVHYARIKVEPFN